MVTVAGLAVSIVLGLLLWMAVLHCLIGLAQRNIDDLAAELEAEEEHANEYFAWLEDSWSDSPTRNLDP